MASLRQAADHRIHGAGTLEQSSESNTEDFEQTRWLVAGPTALARLGIKGQRFYSGCRSLGSRAANRESVRVE